MARTQTFSNGEVGLSVRTKLNSLAAWDSTYSYNIDDITAYSGSFYTSISDSNSGNLPTNTGSWKNLSSGSLSASHAIYSDVADYALDSAFAVSASYAPQTQVPLDAYLSSSTFTGFMSGSKNQFSGTASFAISASYSPPTTMSGLSTGSTYPFTASWSENSNTASVLQTPVIFDAYTDNNNDVTIRNRYDGQSTTAQLVLAIPSVSGSIKASDGTGQDQDVPNIIINSTTGVVVTINDSPIVEINSTGIIPYGEGSFALGSIADKWPNIYATNAAISNITSSNITASAVSINTGSGAPADAVTIKAWLPIQFASEKYYMPLYQ